MQFRSTARARLIFQPAGQPTPAQAARRVATARPRGGGMAMTDKPDPVAPDAEYARSARRRRWWEEPLWIVALLAACSAVVAWLPFR